ncbi:MAG: hypothetical protein ACOX9C_06460 [Kiritimatiellia bacterium]|jgi:hypothetical protein
MSTSSAPKSMFKPNGFTRSQFAAFWAYFGKSCAAQGIKSAYDRETYRKRIMREECDGAEHMSDLNRTRHYDRLLCRLALDAQDYELAARYTAGDERRMAMLCETCATQVMQIMEAETPDPTSYVIGIARQAGFPVYQADGRYWLDLSLGETSTLFSALDTHRRRLLSSANWRGPVKFSHLASYYRDASGCLALRDAPPPPPFLKLKVKS